MDKLTALLQALFGSAGSSEGLSSPGPGQLLMRLFANRGAGESPADAQLNQAGSVMGSDNRLPREAAARQGPLMATLNGTLDALNPMDWMGGMGGAATAAGPVIKLARTGKTFKSAAEPAEGYAARLLNSFKEYTDPMEHGPTLFGVKNRLLPALQYAPGEPNAATNLLLGAKDAGHGPLYEQLSAMKQATPYMNHGYYDPTHQTFLGDALNTLLYDPQKLKTARSLLERGISPDALSEALGFTKP